MSTGLWPADERPWQPSRLGVVLAVARPTARHRCQHTSLGLGRPFLAARATTRLAGPRAQAAVSHWSPSADAACPECSFASGTPWALGEGILHGRAAEPSKANCASARAASESEGYEISGQPMVPSSQAVRCRCRREKLPALVALHGIDGTCGERAALSGSLSLRLSISRGEPEQARWPACCY